MSPPCPSLCGAIIADKTRPSANFSFYYLQFKLWFFSLYRRKLVVHLKFQAGQLKRGAGNQKFLEALDCMRVGCSYGICCYVVYAYSTTKLKLRLKGRSFSTVEGIQETLDTVLKDYYRKCFQEWEKHWDKCIECQGEYSKGD